MKEYSSVGGAAATVHSAPGSSGSKSGADVGFAATASMSASELKQWKKDRSFFFKFILTAYLLMYMEAGAVPAMLISLADTFDMSTGQQGLLGGIVFLSIAVGGPFAGYLLRHYDHRYVVGFSMITFNILTFLWALTPADWSISVNLFIFIRFLMGLNQCVCCIFFPLWTNEFAPRAKTASWMSYLQASVPLGVMIGYIVAAVVFKVAGGTQCFTWYCWRVPLILEGCLLVPFSVSIFFFKRTLVAVPVRHDGAPDAAGSRSQQQVVELANKPDVPQQGRKTTEILMVPRANSFAPTASAPSYSPSIAITSAMSFPPQGTAVTPLGGGGEDGEQQQRRRIQSKAARQKRDYHRLRQSSMAASLYDAMSVRDVIRKSYSSLASLDTEDNLLSMISTGGVQWIDNSNGGNSSSLSSSAARNGSYMNSAANLSSSAPPTSSMPVDIGSNSQKNSYAVGYQLVDEESQHNFSDTSALVRFSTASSSSTPTADSHSESDASVNVPKMNSAEDEDGDETSSEDSLMGGEVEEELEEFSNEIADSDSDMASEGWEGGVREGEGTTSKCGRACSVMFGLLKKSTSARVYTSLVFALSALYFVVSGVQFWGTSFLIVSLKAPVGVVQALFISCAATAPTLGVTFGGWIVDNYGGYKGVKQRFVALRICCIMGLLGGVCTILSLFIRNFWIFVLLLWFVLFFGGAILPACSGIIVSIVPSKHRAMASSISLVVFNLFGYFLSSVLSGYVMQIVQHLFPSCDEACALNIGFKLILLWSLWFLLFLIIGLKSASKAVIAKYGSL